MFLCSTGIWKGSFSQNRGYICCLTGILMTLFGSIDAMDYVFLADLKGAADRLVSVIERPKSNFAVPSYLAPFPYNDQQGLHTLQEGMRALDEKRFDIAITKFKSAADQKSGERIRAWAYYYLGKMFGKGLGVQASEQKMAESFNKAADIADSGAGLEELFVILRILGIRNLSRVSSRPHISFDEAIKRGYLELVRTHLGLGASVEGLFNILGEKKMNIPPLFLAVEYDRIAIAAELLERGASVNIAYDGETLFEYAVRKGNASMVTLLLDKRKRYVPAPPTVLPSWSERAALDYKRVNTAEYGIDINAVRKTDGYRAIEIALEDGLFDIVRLLIEAGADVNPTERHNPLNEVCKAGQVDLVKLMLDNGADPRKWRGKDDDWTPLHSAAGGDYPEIVEMLIERGADVNAETLDDICGTPLHHAAYSGKRRTMEILLSKGADVNALASGDDTALHFSSDCVKKGSAKKVQLLLAAKVDFAKKNVLGETAVHRAAAAGNDKVVKLLLTVGADSKSVSEGGWTPLHYASSANLLSDTHASRSEYRKGHLSVVRYLLDSGAQIDAFGGDGWTALHLAAGRGQVAIVEELLKRKARVDLACKGWTAMHLAARKGSRECVELLLNNGAKMEGFVSPPPYPPLMLAILSSNNDLLSFIFNGLRQIPTVAELCMVVSVGNLKGVEFLFSQCKDIDGVPSHFGEPLLGGGTALHLACKGNNETYQRGVNSEEVVGIFGEVSTGPLFGRDYAGIVAFLLTQNFKGDQPDDVGKTPLHYAVLSGRADVVEVLLKHGVSPDQPADKEENTPLSLAAQGQNGRIIELLLRSLISSEV